MDLVSPVIDPVSPVMGPTVFSCKQCQLGFSSLEVLERHAKLRHRSFEKIEPKSEPNSEPKVEPKSEFPGDNSVTEAGIEGKDSPISPVKDPPISPVKDRPFRYVQYHQSKGDQ
jgi:hypothetical protein